MILFTISILLIRGALFLLSVWWLVMRARTSDNLWPAKWTLLAVLQRHRSHIPVPIIAGHSGTQESIRPIHTTRSFGRPVAG